MLSPPPLTSRKTIAEEFVKAEALCHTPSSRCRGTGHKFRNATFSPMRAAEAGLSPLFADSLALTVESQQRTVGEASVFGLSELPLTRSSLLFSMLVYGESFYMCCTYTLADGLTHLHTVLKSVSSTYATNSKHKNVFIEHRIDFCLLKYNNFFVIKISIKYKSPITCSEFETQILRHKERELNFPSS